MIVKSDSAPYTGNPPPPSTVPVRAEVAPGKFSTIDLPRESLNQYGFVKTVLLNDGTPKILWKTWAATARITRSLPKSMGLDIDFSTLHILVRAGIVEGSKVSPFTTLINIDSLMRHIANASGEAARGYWTPELQEAYSEAWNSYHSQGMTNRPRRAKKAKPAKPARPAREPAAKAAPAPPARRAIHADQPQLNLFPEDQP